MSALNIKAEQTENGVCYAFTRNRIEYSVYIKPDDQVDVWRRNNMRGGSLNLDCYRNGRNQDGKPMAKFLKEAVAFITDKEV